MVKIPEPLRTVIEDYVGNLTKQITIEKAILFGSYAKGSMREHSDVDLAIFSNFFKGSLLRNFNEICTVTLWTWGQGIVPVIQPNDLKASGTLITTYPRLFTSPRHKVTYNVGNT